jgi:hypothetical protein
MINPKYQEEELAATKSENCEMAALPPTELAWQIGKTAATIAFVNEASAYLVGQPRVSPVIMLGRYIEDLKSGKKVLTEFLTVEEYFNSEHTKCMG